MATEVQVPIRLKVLQDSISEFQKILNNLQPNTNNWKALNKIINSMSTEAQRLQAQLSTPFSSEKQFTQANKTIDKLEEAAARVSVVMSGLKFSDIKLTSEQENQFKQFETDINNIREAYKKLLDETKQKLLANDHNKSLIGGIDVKNLDKDFTGIEIAIDSHIKKLDNKIKERNATLEQLRADKALGESATSLITKGMSVESIGEEVFNKYLRQTKSGTLTMNFGDRGVSKQALLDAIGEMYHLEPGELRKTIEESLGKSLNSINAEEINNVFKKMNKSGIFSGIINQGRTSNGKIALQNGEIANLQAQFQEYAQLQKDISKLSNDANLGQASINVTSQVAAMQQRANDLRSSILAGITANNSYTASLNQMKVEFPQLRAILDSTNAEFLKQQQILNSFNSLKMTIANFMGFYQVLNLTKKAIREAANHIKELDTVMNKISIVTDMDTSDLWGQIDQYSAMAQRYGTTIKGAYEVSQIYYQQGLETNDVLTLTNETLKLAKVSGLDYASTTDYMTTAIRGFKMEMQDAATVVDVYSALAANTAVSQEELAVAMSKTASSMESVGSTFQETSAMIATMVAVTRESATNIGSAMKSIGSRYGELTKDPSKLVDSEGEAMSFNKVDAALQSVGISMKTTEGQFREFTDVIIELGEKWDQLESTQQRYIATQFAGNRQQSRFLALVSNIELLKNNIEVATNSADVGTVQAIKALDSLESKMEQVRVAYQQFYTTIGIENVWKGFLDGTRSIIDTLNGMPKLFGKIPLAAINAISIVTTLVKNLAMRGLAFVAQELIPALRSGLQAGEPQMQQAGEGLFQKLNNTLLSKYTEAYKTGQQISQGYAQGIKSGLINKNVNITQGQYDSWMNMAMTGKLGTGSGIFGIAQDRQKLIDSVQSSGLLTESGMNILKTGSQEQIIQFFTTLQGAIAGTGATAQQASSGIAAWSAAHQTALGNIMGVAQAVQLLALAIPTATKEGKQMSGALQAISGAGIAVVSVIKAIGAASATGKIAMPWMAIASGIVAAISGITQFLQANSIEARLEEITKKAQGLSDEAKKLKADFNTLDTSIKKINELEKARYDSAEAAKEYQTAVDQLADTYPELVASYDLNNQAVLNVNAMEETLAKARDESAAATLRAAQAEAEKAKTEKEAAINKLHTENNDLEKYTVLGGLADVNLSEKRKLYRHQVIGDGVADLTTENLEELYDFIDIIKNAGEQHQVDKIISTYEELNKYLVSKNINLDSDLTNALTKAVNAAYTVKGYDNVIENANRTSVSAFMNSYYGNSDSISAFKDNSGLLAAATDELYNHVQDGHYDTVSLTQIANDIFAGIDTLYAGISDNRRKEIDTILSNPSHYSKSDIQTLIPELADTKWINDYFDRQIQYNKDQLTQKVGQLKTNRQSYDEGKLDESLTLLPTQIEQFESAIGDNVTLDLRNLMTSGINQAQNLKKTGQNPQAFIDNFIQFYSQVSTLPAELRNNLINQFSANGFTNEGMVETLKWIENNEAIQEKVNRGEVDFSSLEQMATSFIPTYSLTVASLEDSLTNNLDDIESVFSDLQSGIKGSKLGKTIAKAQELGLDLERSDFKEDGDNFVLRYEKFADLISHLDDIYTTALPEEGEFENAYKNLIRLNQGEKQVDLRRVQDIQKILGLTYHDYFDANDQLKEGVTQEQVYDELKKAYDSTSTDLERYQAWLKIIEQHLTKTIDWKHGDYSTLEGKVDLTQTDESGAAIDTAYKRVQYLAEHPDAYTEDELKEADVPNAVETYQKGMSSLITDLSKYGAKYLINRGQAYDGVASETVSEIQQLAASGTNGVVNAIRKYGHQAGMTVTEINDAIIKALGSGKGTSVANMIFGRKTTLNDINSFLSSYDPDRSIEDFLDENQNLQGALAQVYDYNNLTGELKLKRNATLESVIAAYSEALGVDITKDADLLQQVTQQWITDSIAEEDKNDAGKQMSSVLSTLSSAKVGTRIDLSKSPELSAKLIELGIDVSKGYYEVLSEYVRDSIILQIEDTDEEVQATLKPLQNAIKQKRSGGAIISNLMKDVIGLDDIRNFWQNTTFGGGVVGAEGWTDAQAKAAAEQIGYTWDENLQELIAGPNAIDFYDLLIEYYKNQEGTTQEFLNSLYEKRNNLAVKFRKDEKREALSNLLSNYENAADYIDAVDQQFDVKLREVQGLVTEKDGKEIIDLTKLDEVIPGYDDLLQEAINQLADQYISNMQQAGSLVTQGTTSATEITAFKQAYEQLMHTTLSDSDFIYDYVTNTKILNPQKLRSYLEEAAANSELGLSEDEQRDWVDAQIKALAIDNLDFSTMLSGGATSDQKMQLKRSLEMAFQTYKSMTADKATEAATQVMKDLPEGGQVAIDAMKSTGKELSTDEIEAAYRAQVAPLSALADTLSTLEAGSIVASNQIEALRKVGFDVDANGVIQSTGDLVRAYRGIYNQMKQTGEATLSELNKAMGNLLDNKDGEQQAIDALNNATNMTYSQLAEIYTKAGKELTEYNVAQMQQSGILKALGGNKIMITNFERFASEMGWAADSEEYTNALKAYRDGIISYDQKTGSEIKNIFDAVSGAKLGDKINVTYLGDSLTELFGNTIKNGILTIENALTLPQLAAEIGQIAVEEGGMLASELEDFIASIHDSILNGITGAFGFNVNGTNSISAMQDFAQEYSILTGKTVDYAEMFSYDTILDTFKLDTSYMHEYIEAQKKQLESLGLSGEAVNEYIKDQTVKIAIDNFDITNFINSIGTNKYQEEAGKLVRQIQDIWAAQGSSISDYMALQYVQRIERGGQTAVNAIKAIKGTDNVTEEEIQQAYLHNIDTLNEVLNDVNDLVAGQFVGTSGKLYEILNRAGAVDDKGVVQKGFDMVRVYAEIYAEMSKTAGATTAGLNDVYAQLLTAQDQVNIDITNALKSGNGMSYTDFGKLLANYNIKFEDFMNNAATAITVMRDGFGNIRITDWEGFAKSIFKVEDLNSIKNTDEYISAFKAYNDGLIELNKKTEKTIKDEILQISNAKAGDQLNLSYLWTALQNVIDNATRNIAPENYSGNVDLANRPIVPAEKMKQVFENFEDDYATLYSESFIFGDEFGENAGVLFTTLTASGEIVKDLADYVQQLYDEADGNLDYMSELDSERRNLMLYGKRNTSYEELGEYANDIHIRAAAKDDINYYLKALQAVGANYADGILTISEDADMIAIGDILSILSDLSGVDLGEEGLAAIKDAVDDLLKNIASLISNGAKGSLTNSDAATLSQWYRSTAKDYGAVMNELDFTETAEGLKLTETSLANVYDLMKRIDGIKASALLDDIISTRESFQTLTGALREFNDAMRLDGISEGTNKLKGLNSALSNTAKMMQDIVQKAMTSPDSMNFMSNKLPDDMQTAVNAWENASQAIKTITAAEKSGYMGVQDFYNIVNTASSLMVAAGKEFQVAGKDAATLLKEGADNVKVVDGKLTVDISSAGLNIVGSADQLKQNMATGINELADAEIAIIDAEIQVLEILAAMEQMSDMDVDIDNDGLTFEIEDIFDAAGNFTEVAGGMQPYLDKLKEVVDESDTAIKAFQQFKINGTSLYELLTASAETWKQVFGSEENVSKFMQKFTKGVKGWDLEGNLQSDVLNFMKGLGQDYSIDLGNAGIFHVNASGISYVIDFSDEERMNAAKQAAESSGLKDKIGKTDEEFKKYLKDLVNKGDTENGKSSTLSLEENYVLKVATGQIEVVKDKTGKEQYKVGGKLYNNKSIANAAAELIQAGAEADWDELSKREVDLGDKETIPGKLKINNATVNVETDGKGNLTYRHDNYTGKSLEELYTNWFEGENQDKGWTREEHGLEFKEWQVKQGISVEPVFNIGGKEGNAKTNQELRDTIQKAIDNGIQEGKVNKQGKAYEVELDGVTMTIPKEKITQKDGQSLEDAIQEYLRDNYNTIDLDLKDTIAAGITKAFNDLKDSIKDLDSKPLTEIAGALEQIISSIKQLADEKGVEKLNEEIGKVDTEALTKVGDALQKISTSLQTLATSGNWLIVTVALGLISTALSSINENSGVFETIQSGIDGLGGDQLLQTVKDTLEKIRDALKEIKENSNIPITIDASGADNALSTLEKIAKLLSKLTGQNFGLEGEGGDNGPPGFTLPGQEKLPKPPIPESEQTPQNLSFENGNGPINPNLQNEVVKIQTEYEQPSNTIEEPEEVKVPTAFEPPSDGMPEELPEVKLPMTPEVEDTKIEESGTAKLTPELDGEIPEQNSIAHFTADVEDVKDQNATAHYTAVTTGQPGDLHLTAYYTVKMSGSVKAAEGNVGLVQGTFGQAKAKGTPTLMGELGPELVVQDGHYFIAGQQGAEMVPLTKDAIVFNHLQTDSLLKKGMSKGRGRAVTNERNAVSFATGNVGGGPAMASASAALAQLKALRAMWESLKSAKVSDLAGAGGGGGGGGGGKDDSPQIVDPRTWIATVERWYNLTQEIAKLEKEITYQQQIREKIQSDWQKDGKAYYASQKKSLSALEDQIDAQEQLNVSRQEYYNKRIAALKEDKFGQIYTFDEEGQLKFNKNANLTLGDKTYTNAMEWYTDLVGFDNDKGANYTNKEKYEMLVANGFESYMKYDENGQEIKMDADNNGEITDEERESYYENATKAFKDKLDSFAEATQSLWDEIQEGNKTLEELETARNELLKEMRDNQMELENKVLDAIVEMREREINALQDQRDALEESVGKYIDGLSNALSKEQDMYDRQEQEDELNRNRRRLAILQRSGGSVSDINALQSDIRDQERELYFDAQQAQIDAIQEASDKEIERLDNQIELMTEQLEYQKQFGLLWGDVYEVMNWSATAITDFISGHTSEYWESSPLATAEKVNETLFQAEAWKSYAEDLHIIAEETRAQQLARDYAIFDQAMKAEYGDDYDSTGKWKERFKEVYEDAEQGGRSETETRKILQGDIAEEAYVRSKQKLAAEHGVSYIGTGEWSYKSIDDNQHYAYHYENKNGQWTYVNRRKENHSWSNGVCSKCGHTQPAPPPSNSGGGGGGGGGSSDTCSNCQIVCGGACTNKCARECANQCATVNRNKPGSSNPTNSCKNSCTADCKSGCRANTQKLPSSSNGQYTATQVKKAAGGYVKHGFYELGERGTETVLTAEQTRVLRNNILSNRPSSLISLLKTYNEGFSRMESPLTGTTTEDNSVTIENASVNMNVQQISNDYDARRAGEQAMNEMMRIARKTSAANSIRR